MTNAQAIAIILGAVMPPLVSLVTQSGWPRWANFAVAVASSAIAGAAIVWARGELSWSNAVSTAALVLVASQSVYAAYWRGTPANKKLQRVTSVIRGKD